VVKADTVIPVMVGRGRGVRAMEGKDTAMGPSAVLAVSTVIITIPAVIPVMKRILILGLQAIISAMAIIGRHARYLTIWVIMSAMPNGIITVLLHIQHWAIVYPPWNTPNEQRHLSLVM